MFNPLFEHAKRHHAGKLATTLSLRVTALMIIGILGVVGLAFAVIAIGQ